MYTVKRASFTNSILEHRTKRHVVSVRGELDALQVARAFEREVTPLLERIAALEKQVKDLQAVKVAIESDDSTQELPLIAPCSNCKTETEVESFNGLSQAVYLCEDCRVELEQE